MNLGVDRVFSSLILHEDSSMLVSYALARHSLWGIPHLIVGLELLQFEPVCACSVHKPCSMFPWYLLEAKKKHTKSSTRSRARSYMLKLEY